MDAHSYLGVVLFAVADYLILGGVLLVAVLLLQNLRWTRRLSWPTGLALAHTLLLAACIALYPTGIFFGEIPYDDIYTAYIFIPGPLLWRVSGPMVQACWTWLPQVMSYHDASLVCIVFIPGAVGLVLGALQWYGIGWLWAKFFARKAQPGGV